MAMPTVTVDLALTSGYTTAAASRTWTDVSTYVEGDRPITIQRGRPDQFSAPQPSRLGVLFDNTDGRFTPENASGAYYPNIKKGRPIRVRVATTGNLLVGNDNSFESGLGNWSAISATAATSTTRAVDGSQSLLATWPGTLGTPRVQVSTTLTVGATYTFSASVYVPSGSPDVVVGVLSIGDSAAMSTKNAWVRISYTFVAGSNPNVLWMRPTNNALAGTAYMDAVQLEPGSSMTTFTTAAAATYDRVLGYVDEWPVEWPGDSQSMATCAITATSRQTRLGRTAPFKSIVEEEYLYDVPVLYFPLGEPSGSTTAGNIAPGRSDVLSIGQAGTGGTLTFGQGTGPGTDDLSAPVFAPASIFNGLYLTTAPIVPVVLGDGQSVDFECFVNTTASGSTVTLISGVHAVIDGGFAKTVLYLDTTGHPKLEARASAVSVPVATSATAVNDGNTHHISGRLALSGGTITPSIVVDGGTRTTGASGSGTFIGSSMTYTRFSVGGDEGSGLFTGTLAHAAFSVSSSPMSDARVASHANAGLTGFSGESSDARIQRIARLAGIPTAEVFVETGLTTSMAHKDTTGETPAALMQDVAETEDGVVFDAKDGTLTFHSRSHRYGATSAFTLSVAAGDVEGGLTPRLDDQHLTNDMTASRPNGITVRSTNAASITEYGYYRESLEVLTTSDNEVQSRADWQVNRFGVPRVSVPNIRVDLATCSSSLQASLLAADIGTKFTVTGLPSQAPASTMDFFIEGISEEIGVNSYFMEFAVSAAAYANVWQLDSATLSQLDSTTVLAY